jgi:hypothetical protein
MFNHRHYVPILKWKMGEYQALSRLNDETKNGLTPLLEVPPVGFDHESGQYRESVDAHLGDFGRRLKSKWQNRDCFVDLKYLPLQTRLAGGRHYVECVFADARNEGCTATPVVSFASDMPFFSAVAAVNQLDKRGVCLRLGLQDFDRPSLTTDITSLLQVVGVGWAETDLIIDFSTPNYVPISAFVRVMQTLLAMVPNPNRWRTVTLTGTAYPQSVATLTQPFQIIPRHEWLAYRMLVNQLGRDARIPTFGDYGVAHPDLVELDMRLIKPFAKLRYTIDDNWHIGRGTPVRTHGFGQYQQMCQLLTQQPYFSGRGYSAGDTYIADCAAGRVATGNLSTWVWVATNRHLTKVVADLSILHAI